MSVLSEWDIVKELGKGIFIYPFEDFNKHLSGCSLKLTASEYAYIVKTQKCYPIKTEAIITVDPDNVKVIKEVIPLKIRREESNNNKKYLIIPPRTTTLIWTQQSIIFNGQFCGSVHSKVDKVASGIGHIGTRVNPYWKGVLSIAFHNLLDEDIEIMVGDTIAYIRFHKLETPSSESYSDSRKTASAKLSDAFPKSCIIPQELKEWIQSSGWRDGDTAAFLDELEKDRINNKQDLTAYEKAERVLWIERIPSFLSPIRRFWPRNQKIPWQLIFFALSFMVSFIFNIVQLFLCKK